MDGSVKLTQNIDTHESTSTQTLQQRAEAVHRAAVATRKRLIEPQSPQTMQILHDLEVHQIELEMQNEELRKTMAELDHTRARYFDFYDMAPVGYCTLSEQGLIWQANLATANLLGVPRAALIEQPFTRFMRPDTQDDYYRLRQKTLNSDEGQSTDLCMIRSDGSAVWVYLQTLAVTDDDGAHRIRLVLSDITQKTKLEQELRQHAEKIRIQALALDQIQDTVTITDVNGIVTYLNQAGHAHPKFKDGNGVGQHVSKYGSNKRADVQHDEIIHTTLTQGGWTGQIVNTHADGAEAVYQLRTRAVIDESGATIAMVGVGTDITHRLKLEQELQQREQYLRALLDNFPFQVWLKAIDGRYLAVNQAFASLHGAPSVQALEGKRFDEIVDGPLGAQALEDDREVANNRSGKHIEILLPVNGEPRWFETYKAPIVMQGKQVVGTVGFSRDVTERKQVELELIAAKANALKANEAMSQFMAAASHDLRQPIFALTLFFNSLKKKVVPGNAELVRQTENCIETLSETLNDLLAVSKLEAGVIIPEITDFSVGEMQSSLSAMYSAPAHAAGLKLRWRKCDLIARTDRILLSRIIGNFVDNAIRHTRKGGVLLACRMHAGRRWIEVWDTGIGIAADKTALIFEAFRRLDDAAQIPGSGLGLTIADKTATLLGLQLRMRSRPGRGSMFAIELPLGERIQPAPVVDTQSAAPQLRIGLVEDNPRVLQALTLTLEDDGHEVVAASSGKALVEGLGAQAPDILISDYRLTGVETGFDVVKTIRKIFGSSLPALLITGDTDPALIRSMGERDITVLYKPLQPDVLRKYIRQEQTMPEQAATIGRRMRQLHAQLSRATILLSLTIGESQPVRESAQTWLQEEINPLLFGLRSCGVEGALATGQYLKPKNVGQARALEALMAEMLSRLQHFARHVELQRLENEFLCNSPTVQSLLQILGSCSAITHKALSCS